MIIMSVLIIKMKYSLDRYTKAWDLRCYLFLSSFCALVWEHSYEQLGYWGLEWMGLRKNLHLWWNYLDRDSILLEHGETDHRRSKSRYVWRCRHSLNLIRIQQMQRRIHWNNRGSSFCSPSNKMDLFYEVHYCFGIHYFRIWMFFWPPDE